jgi:hypothetical protein
MRKSERPLSKEIALYIKKACIQAREGALLSFLNLITLDFFLKKCIVLT